MYGNYIEVVIIVVVAVVVVELVIIIIHVSCKAHITFF